MSTPARIGAFVAGLAVLFTAAFGFGKVLEDDSSEDAWSLRLEAGELVEGAPVPIRFDVRDADDAVVTDFAIRHEKPLHLIAVRKDFGGYRHLHPTMDNAGSWAVDADLGPGPWRLYADFQPAGGELQVLTSDLDVPGTYGTVEVERFEEQRAWSDEDGYAVEVVGSLTAGAGSDLGFRISRDGKPVTDLQPYLGSYGHLVVIRDSDLGYQHAHPDEGPAGPEVGFGVEVPSEGGYHLFVDFQHDGVVRTASFEVDAVAGGAAPEEHGGDHGDH